MTRSLFWGIVVEAGCLLTPESSVGCGARSNTCSICHTLVWNSFGRGWWCLVWYVRCFASSWWRTTVGLRAIPQCWPFCLLSHAIFSSARSSIPEYLTRFGAWTKFPFDISTASVEATTSSLLLAYNRKGCGGLWCSKSWACGSFLESNLCSGTKPRFASCRRWSAEV